MVAPDLLRHLPHSALAAVVIASAIGLFEIADLRRIYRIQRWEFWLSIGCCAGVAVLGADPGHRPGDRARGHRVPVGRLAAAFGGAGRRDEGLKGYHDITRHPEARQIPGLLLFRWDAPLFFANAEWFHRRVLEAVAAAPTPVRWLVVAAEPVTSVDVTSADMLAELDETLHAAGIETVLCRDEGPGQGQVEALRALRQAGRGGVLSDRRRGRFGLPQGPSFRIGERGRGIPVTAARQPPSAMTTASTATPSTTMIRPDPQGDIPP